MMIDTLEFAYLTPSLGQSEIDDFARSVRGSLSTKVQTDGDTGHRRETRWWGEVTGIGTVNLCADGRLTLPGRSLAKWCENLRTGLEFDRCDNDGVLTAREANETFQAITERAEETFDWLDPETLRVTRLDVVYQRHVEDSIATLQSLVMAMKQTRKGSTWWFNDTGQATGLRLNGRAVVHRVYDKGLEGGNEMYRNVLRSEEQLRHTAAAFPSVVNVAERTFDREAAREVLNTRYLDVVADGQIDVSALLDGGKEAVAIYVMHPELLPHLRRRLKRSQYFKIAKEVKEHRAAAVPADMRVPPDAWT